MVQVKVYGTRTVWDMKREDISDAIHRAVVSAWGLPEDKRFHRSEERRVGKECPV